MGNSDRGTKYRYTDPVVFVYASGIEKPPAYNVRSSLRGLGRTTNKAKNIASAWHSKVAIN